MARGESVKKRKAKRRYHCRNRSALNSKGYDEPSGSNSTPPHPWPRYGKPKDPEAVQARAPVLSHLNLDLFLLLPLSIIANICKFLNLTDLPNLSRTCVRMRALFMSRISKPCWDEARWLQNIIEWKGVASPRAATFLFDIECQGYKCPRLIRLRTFYVCKRYCKYCASHYLVDIEEVPKRWPTIPRQLVKLLPWTRKRASAQKGNEVDTGRFLLLEEIEQLERRITGLDRSALSSLEVELRGKLRDSEKMAQQMEAWAQRYDGRIWHANSERFVQFMQGLKKRWGWDFNGKPKVTGKRKFDQLLRWVEEAPELNQDVWDRAEKVLRGLMADAELSKPATARPWSLKAAPEAGPSSIPN